MRRLIFVLALVAALVPHTASADPPGACFGESVNDNRATDGDDYLTGSDELDVIALSSGDDQYFASTGNDLVCGNGGADIIAGEGGGDSIDGGPGADTLLGMTGDDIVKGNLGPDEVQGNGGDDVLRGGTGDGERDDIYDGLGNDTVVGDEEDFWHKCADDVADTHDNFLGTIVPDPDCSA
jgi:Ca2+-binding RTX toxin-like protein